MGKLGYPHTFLAFMMKANNKNIGGGRGF